MERANRPGARLCEPQRVAGSVTWKLVWATALLATRCESVTRAPATPASGARLCEPQQVDGIGTSKLVPVPVPLTTPCGSQTRAPATPATFGGPCQDAHRDVRGEIYGLFFPSDHFICFHDKRRQFIRKLRTLGFNGPLSGTRHPCHHPVPLRPTLPGW